MKRFILLIVVLCLTAIAVNAVAPEAVLIPTPPSGISGYDIASATWRVIPVDRAGGLSADAPVPSNFIEATLTLTPNTVHTIAPVPGRVWIILKAYPTNTVPIWLAFNNASFPAVINSGYPLAPGAVISRRMPSGLIIGVIASTTATVFHSQEVR